MLPMHWGTCKKKLLLIQKEKKTTTKELNLKFVNTYKQNIPNTGTCSLQQDKLEINQTS